MPQRPKEDRRKQYRIYVPDDQLIEVVLLEPKHDQPGRMLDVVRNGLGASFPRKSAPVLRVGQKVRTKINMAALSGSLDAELVTRNRVDERRLVRYGFKFADAGEFFSQLDRSLWHLFSQRRAFRVQPGPDESIEVDLTWEAGSAPAQVEPQQPVGVELKWKGGSARARMIDVSVIGIGLIVDAQTTLPEEAQLTVSFILPEHDSAMQFDGVVRNRRPQGDSMRYGMEYVGKESDRHFRAQQKVISTYVMRRQRQMLRERRDESDAPESEPGPQ